MSSSTRLAFACIAIICGGLSCESPVAPTPNTTIGLRVWAEVAPATLSIRDTAAVLRIRVYVENPAGDTLRVRSGAPPFIFTSDPTRSQGLKVSFRIASATDSLNAGPNTDYWGDSVYVFPPHDVEYTEATVSIHQWRVAGWPLVPGHLRLRAWFNGHEGSSAPFQLVP